MHNAATIDRTDIAEIYDRLAEMSGEAAMNEGEPGDISHVVTHLGKQARWQDHAEDVRDTIELGKPIGSRVR